VAALAQAQAKLLAEALPPLRAADSSSSFLTA